MRLGHFNDTLFTGGNDGCLVVHEVKDRDPRTGLPRAVAQPMYSDDILAEREQMDETKATKKNLLGELGIARETNHTLSEEASANDQNDKIKKLKEQR